MPKENSYVISDPSAQRVCTLSGLGEAQEQLVTFKELNRGIAVSLAEVEANRSRANFASNALLVLKFTKATCDAFISMAADLSPGKGTNLVKNVHGVLSIAAETAGEHIAGGKPDYVETSARMVTAGSEFINSQPIKFVVKNHGIKSELVIATLNDDERGVKNSGIDYFTELVKFSFDALDREATSRFIGIAKASFDYHQALGEAFDGALEARGQTQQSYDSQKKIFLDLGRRFRKKIDDLDNFIQTCGSEMSERLDTRNTA